MAAFKMRSHLLLAEIEEKDEVYCPFIREEKLESNNQMEDDEYASRIRFR